MNNSLYYLDDTGAMYSDMEITIDGVNYIIDEDGRVFEDEFTIIQQPKNGYGVVDAEVSLRIKALKADTYQWYYSAEGETWSEVTDALADGYTTDTLVLNITGTTASYQYRCVVTDQEGMTLTSENVSIIITPAESY